MDMGDNQRVLESEWIEKPLDHQMELPPSKDQAPHTDTKKEREENKHA
jgi:hypothetical protein